MGVKGDNLNFSLTLANTQFCIKISWLSEKTCNNFLSQKFMALIPFKTTEKQGKASSKTIFSLALMMTSLVAWMCLFK